MIAVLGVEEVARNNWRTVLGFTWHETSDILKFDGNE